MPRAAGKRQSSDPVSYTHLDVYKRQAGTSKEDFERAKRTAKKMWKGRKTTAYLKCPNCGQMLSVPKGKGKIRVTCPKCHAKMETRS